MSYTELHTGTLRKLPFNTENDIKTYLKEVLIAKNPEKKDEILSLNDYDDINDELWYANLHRKYYVDWDKELIYEILNHKKYDDEEYIDDWEQLPNGDIKFITQFYNGGCSFDEAVKWGLKKINT